MMLSLENVYVNYGSIQVLHGINIEVNEGEIVTIIGANGAGKSTTLKAIAGLVTKTRNSSIKFMGEDITDLPPEKIVSKGISLAPEGRRIFPDLTVLENLEMGAYLRAKDKAGVRKDLESIFEMFPILEQRRNQSGKTLSGGEQQMLAIGRALTASPSLLMLDEPSLGLAPKIVEQIFDLLVRLNKEKNLTILLVEQNANAALKISSFAYILETGSIGLQGPSAELASNDLVRAKYLGA